MTSNVARFLWTRNLCNCLPIDRDYLMKASFFSRMPLKTESSVEVRFLIDSCRCFRQSNKLKTFIKDYDWLILACFIRERSTADATFIPWKNVWFENSAECNRRLLLFLKKKTTTIAKPFKRIQSFFLKKEKTQNKWERLDCALFCCKALRKR